MTFKHWFFDKSDESVKKIHYDTWTHLWNSTHWLNHSEPLLSSLLTLLLNLKLFIWQTEFYNIGSFGKKGTYTVQFPAKMNTSGRKHQQFFTFLHKLWLRGRLSINNDLFSCGSLYNTII